MHRPRRRRLDRNVALCSRPTTMSSAHSVNARKNVHAQMPYSFQAFAHESSMVRERRYKERDIVKTKASWLLERYSSEFNLLPFLSSLIHILFSTYLLWISPTPPKRKTPPHLRPLPKSLALRFETSSALLLSSRTKQ